ALTDDIAYRKQESHLVSFAPSFSRQEGWIDFQKEASEVIERKSRALYPWPGTFFFLDKKRIKVLSLIESDKKLKPSEVKVDNGLFIGCAQGTVEILKLQREGKPPMNAQQFLAGLQHQPLITS